MKLRSALLASILMVLGACGGASGPGAGTPATSAPGAAAQPPQGCGPKGSGSLTILGTRQEEYVKGVTKTCEAACGIKMSYVRLSSGEALAKLRAEKANPQFTV